jgi:hypothetical protein
MSTSGNPLDDWRRKNGLSYAELGRRLGVTKSHARKHCLPRDHKDARGLGFDKLRRVVEITGGAVTADSFLGLEPDDASHG